MALAEHAVDLHAELFGDTAERLVALDALARDLIRRGRPCPEFIRFLQRVDDYIQIVQDDLDVLLAPSPASDIGASEVAGSASVIDSTSVRRLTPMAGFQAKATPLVSRV